MARRINVGQLTDLTPKDANFVIEYCKDFDARRAALASGYNPDTGYRKRDEPQIEAAIATVLEARLESSHIDAEWALMEAVDNHMIARQMGNITASNTALNLIMKHVAVDAMAKDRVEVTGNLDAEIVERIRRGRKRADDNGDQEITFL